MVHANGTNRSVYSENPSSRTTVSWPQRKRVGATWRVVQRLQQAEIAPFQEVGREHGLVFPERESHDVADQPRREPDDQKDPEPLRLPLGGEQLRPGSQRRRQQGGRFFSPPHEGYWEDILPRHVPSPYGNILLSAKVCAA